MLRQYRSGRIAHSMFAVCMLATAAVAVATLNREPGIAQTSQQSGKSVFSYTAEEGKNVFEQTQDKVAVEAKMSQSETLVQSVDEVKSHGKKQWKLYIDGKLTFENPVTYVTSGGEKVEWRLE